jgi:hypothetical protein
MAEFLGLLFGSCIRTGVRLTLDLPAFVWKALVEEPLSRADLAAVDTYAAESLRFIETCDAATFAIEGAVEQTFTTTLSNGTVVELKEKGAATKVSYETRGEYESLVLAARLSEHKLQIDAIRRGMAKVVPLELLPLMTWKEIEVAICGKPEIDIDLLRRHTRYSESIPPNAPYIEYFWNVLRSFDQDMRRLFIRFAWAQDRLPADDAEFVRSRTRLLIKPAAVKRNNPDLALPTSDTCFFNLVLPAYSSEEVMRAKLLKAISTAMSMDADNPVEEHGADRRSRDDEEEE